MLKEMRAVIVMVVLFTALTGLAYPLAMTGLAQLLFPDQSNGSLIRSNGKVIGSSLIGQTFTDPAYFWGRPSTAGAGYDAASSGGSNLGPTSKALFRRVSATALALSKQAGGAEVPVDLVTASASGLDPDISPAGAYFQAQRIAAARQVPVTMVLQLIRGHIEGRTFGILGEPRVNVILINMALDKLAPKPDAGKG